MLRGKSLAVEEKRNPVREIAFPVEEQAKSSREIAFPHKKVGGGTGVVAPIQGMGTRLTAFGDMI